MACTFSSYSVFPALYLWCSGMKACWRQFLNWAVRSTLRIHCSFDFIVNFIFVCCCSQIFTWKNSGNIIIVGTSVLSVLLFSIKFHFLSSFSWRTQLQHTVYCDFSWERQMLSWGGVQGLSVEWSCGLNSIALFYLV